MTKAFKKYFIIILSVIMSLTAMLAVEAVIPVGTITAYAASVSAPKPKASNVTPSSVELKWKKVKSAKKYVIYRSTEKTKGYKKIKTVKASTVKYKDSKLTPGKTYYYKVTAINGKNKKASSPVKIKAVPAGVKGLDGESKSCGSVSLSFKKVSGVTGYEIRYSPTQNKGYKVVANQKGLTFNHYIGEGITGYYKVRAYKTVKGKKIYGAYSYILAVETYAHSYSTSVTKPTCVSEGYTTYTCSICGNSYNDNITSKTEHKFGSYAVDVPALCSSAGSKHRECKVCGFKEYAAIAATGEHHYGAYAVTTAPTCLSDGVETAVCTYCGKSTDRKVNAVGHSYRTYTISPDCTNNGSEITECTRCGDKTVVNIDALGHSYDSVIVEPSCVDNGYTTHICTRCNDTYNDSFVSAKGHTYISVILREADCENEGEESVDCINCDSSYKKAVPAKGHDYSTTIVKPTCTEDGYTKFTCNRCFYSYTEPIEAKGHSFTINPVRIPDTNTHTLDCDVCYEKSPAVECEFTASVTKAPTKLEEGIMTYTCICGNSYTVPIDKVDCNHEAENFRIEGNIEPTCDSLGYTGDRYCNECNTLMEIGVPIPKTEHDYAVTQAKLEPTCTASGAEEVKTCRACGNVVGGEPISSLGHDLYTENIISTCKEQGYTVEKCTRCDYENRHDYKPLAEHTFTVTEPQINPTCTKEGKTAVETCTVCGATTGGELMPALTENGECDFVPEKNEKGYIVYTCSKCGTVEIDTTCYINLTDNTVSVPDVAMFTVSAANNNKLELNYDGVSDYEITGVAKDLSIDVNASSDCEVKLAGVDIENKTLDIINIKNKSTGTEQPIVSVSAKVDTVNTLKTTEAGNAIDGNCKLSLKGRGKLILDTIGTSISNTGKIYIKNLVLDITSQNRGIDTKENVVVNGVADTEFYNIELGANAVITINSWDDGIRCKYFDSIWLGVGDTDSILTINAGHSEGGTEILADGIQLEGKSANRSASIILHSGTISITNNKESQLNNKSNKTPVANGTARASFYTTTEE